MSATAKTIAAHMLHLDDVSRQLANCLQGDKFYRRLRKKAAQNIRFTFELCLFLDRVDALAAQSHSHLAKYTRDQKIPPLSSNRSFPAHHG